MAASGEATRWGWRWFVPGMARKVEGGGGGQLRSDQMQGKSDARGAMREAGGRGQVIPLVLKKMGGVGPGCSNMLRTCLQPCRSAAPSSHPSHALELEWANPIAEAEVDNIVGKRPCHAMCCPVVGTLLLYTASPLVRTPPASRLCPSHPPTTPPAPLRPARQKRLRHTRRACELPLSPPVVRGQRIAYWILHHASPSRPSQGPARQ